MSKLPADAVAAAVNLHLAGRLPAPDRPAATPPASPPARPRARAPARAVAATPRPPASPRVAARPAWIDPYTVRTASDGLDEVLDYVNWVLHITETALCAEPDPAGPDAWLFAGAVWERLGHLRETPCWLAVHRAANLGDTATAAALESAIRQHNAGGLLLPDHLRTYAAQSVETGTDYTRRKRGGDPWRHAERDRALAREAYDWRLIHHDWRRAHPDLAAPSACLAWTANHLTDTLDRIAKRYGEWPTDPPKEQQFFPSDELCAAHGRRVGDDQDALRHRPGRRLKRPRNELHADNDQDALLHNIYPRHFRGLLIGHVAALCLEEWARRITDGPAPI
ncbi:MAG: hypothetical protein AB7N69_09530 [Immundisolibacter sp.]|uniref:hypothetical protein n=1 Tax=Immundisolibacter sp. TaxID=1934948 RepID=UPI003D0B2E6A